MKNLNTDKSCSRTKLQARESACAAGTRTTACWKLEAWMWGKNAPKHRGNTQIQTPAKGGKNEKEGKKKKAEEGKREEGWAIEKSKKKYACWKCTHRAGVKCGEKNGNVAQKTVWRCEPGRGAFSLDVSLQFCHVTHPDPTSSNERAASNS